MSRSRIQAIRFGVVLVAAVAAVSFMSLSSAQAQCYGGGGFGGYGGGSSFGVRSFNGYGGSGVSINIGRGFVGSYGGYKAPYRPNPYYGKGRNFRPGGYAPYGKSFNYYRGSYGRRPYGYRY